MKNNEKKYLFFNKKIVMITATVMMMGQICFMPKIAQNTVEATQQIDDKIIVSKEDLYKRSNNPANANSSLEELTSATSKNLGAFVMADEANAGGQTEGFTNLMVGLVGNTTDKAFLTDFLRRCTGRNMNLYRRGDQKLASMFGKFFKDNDGRCNLLAVINNMANDQRLLYADREKAEATGLGLGSRLAEAISAYLDCQNSIKQLLQAIGTQKDDKKIEKLNYYRSKMNDLAVKVGIYASLVKQTALTNSKLFERSVVKFLNGDNGIQPHNNILNQNVADDMFKKIIVPGYKLVYQAISNFADGVIKDTVLPAIKVEKINTQTATGNIELSEITNLDVIENEFLKMAGINEGKQFFDSIVTNNNNIYRQKAFVYFADLMGIYLNNTSNNPYLERCLPFDERGAQLAGPVNMLDGHADAQGIGYNNGLVPKYGVPVPGAMAPAYDHNITVGALYSIDPAAANVTQQQRNAAMQNIADFQNFSLAYRSSVYGILDSQFGKSTGFYNLLNNADYIKQPGNNGLLGHTKTANFAGIYKTNIIDAVPGAGAIAPVLNAYKNNEYTMLGLIVDELTRMGLESGVNLSSMPAFNIRWNRFMTGSVGPAAPGGANHKVGDYGLAMFTKLINYAYSEVLSIDYAKIMNQKKEFKKVMSSDAMSAKYISLIEEEGKYRLGGTYIAGRLDESEASELVTANIDRVKRYLAIVKILGKNFANIIPFNKRTFEIGESGSDPKSPKDYNDDGIRIEDLTRERFEVFLKNIINMYERLRVYNIESSDIYSENAVLNALFSLYKAISDLSNASFKKSSLVGKEDLLSAIRQNIIEQGEKNSQKRISVEDIDEVLEKIRNRDKIEFKKNLEICKPFIYLDNKEINEITDGITSIGRDTAAEIFGKIIKSNSTVLREKLNEEEKSLIKETWKTEISGEDRQIARYGLSKTLKALIEKMRTAKNAIYNDARDGLNENISKKSVNNEIKVLYGRAQEAVGGSIRAESVTNYSDLVDFARRSKKYYETLEKYWDDKRDDYADRSFILGDVFGTSSPRNIQEVFFKGSKDMWGRFADDLDEYLKAKDKPGEDDKKNAYRKMRDMLYNHITMLIENIYKFLELGNRESEQWDNLAKLLKDVNSEELKTRLSEYIKRVVQELNNSLSYSNLEDVMEIYRMIGSGDIIGMFFNTGSATEIMKASIENIKKLLTEASKGQQNSDFVKQGIQMVQRIVLYETIYNMFTRTLFPREYTVRNFNFSTGRNEKDEVELNKEHNLAINKELIAAKNFREKVLTLLEEMTQGELYKGMNRESWLFNNDNQYSNREKYAKQKINELIGKTNEVFDKLEKYYDGDNLSTDEKVKEVKDDDVDENDDKVEEKDEKEEKEVEEKNKGDMRELISKCRGKIIQRPFKDRNQMLSEGELEYEIDSEKNTVKVRLKHIKRPGNDYKILCRSIINGIVNNKPYIMDEVSDDVFELTITFNEKLFHRIALHFSLRDAKAKTPIDQIEAKAFICGLDLTNLTDLTESDLKSAKKTTATFFDRNDKKLDESKAPKMDAYKLGSKILVIARGADFSNDVATALSSIPGAKPIEVDNIYSFAKFEGTNVYAFVIENNVASQLGDEFTIHCNTNQQRDETFKYYAKINFKEAENISVNEKENRENEAKEMKEDKLKVETDEDDGEEVKEVKDKKKTNKGKKNNKKNNKKKGKGNIDEDEDEDGEDKQGEEDEESLDKKLNLIDVDKLNERNYGSTFYSGLI